VPAYEVVLADGAVDGEGMVTHVGRQRAVGAIGVNVRTEVRYDGELRGRYIERSNATDRSELAVNRHEHGGRPALVSVAAPRSSANSSLA
jgi:hypothetical protein